MAISYVSAGSQYTAFGNPVTFSFSVASGSDTLLEIMGSNDSGSATALTAVTYNSVSATLRAQKKFSDPLPTRFIEVWTLASPATGSNTVSVSYNNSTAFAVAAAKQFDGVDLTDPINATQTASAFAASISTAAISTVSGGMVSDSAHHGATSLAATGGMTIRWTANSDFKSGATQAADGSNITPGRSWTGNAEAVIVALSYKVAGGGGDDLMGQVMM